MEHINFKISSILMCGLDSLSFITILQWAVVSYTWLLIRGIGDGRNKKHIFRFSS